MSYSRTVLLGTVIYQALCVTRNHIHPFQNHEKKTFFFFLNLFTWKLPLSKINSTKYIRCTWHSMLENSTSTNSMWIWHRINNRSVTSLYSHVKICILHSVEKLKISWKWHFLQKLLFPQELFRNPIAVGSQS